MAIVTVVAAGDMRRMFARGDGAVVAGAASTNDLRVVHGVGRCPGNIVVAVLTHIGGLDVCRVLAGGFDTVVASGTVGDDIDVIEIGRQPCHRGVAVIALATRGDVSGILARRDRAIVTGITGAQYLGVVDHVCRCPQVTVVAILTNLGGLDVGRVLTGRFDAVMATGTVGHNVGVIKGRREPPRRRMAVITIVAAGEVRRILA